MSLVTPHVIQALQRKLYLKAKQEFISTDWGRAGNADIPQPTFTKPWVS